MKKTHYFLHAGTPRTLCGIPDRDGVIFETGIRITCQRCLKIMSTVKLCAICVDIYGNKNLILAENNGSLRAVRKENGYRPLKEGDAIDMGIIEFVGTKSECLKWLSSYGFIDHTKSYIIISDHKK